ncbi:amino acid racemase [bacterium]|nr:amino acid racemase [bacterium]
MSQTIGILGGMGPEATVCMYESIIKNTRVKKDQDHIPVIILSNPKVPPRTEAIFNKAPDPTPILVKGAKTLEQAGADFIIMPCITAHFFLSRITSQIHVPFISLLEESLQWALNELTGVKKVGILSSTGTLKSQLFHKTFAREDIDIINPEEKEQVQVMEAIFGPHGVKAGFTTGFPEKTAVRIANSLMERGAGAIIAGCTEIPLILKPQSIPVPLIEPMSLAARAAIKKAGYPLREKITLPK